MPWIIAGVIFTIIGIIFSAIGGYLEKKENEELQKELTGDGNAPTLIISYDNHTRPNDVFFYTVNFTLRNNSNYPLEAVDGYINDMLGENMLNFGELFVMEGNALVSRKVMSDDFKDWKQSRPFSLGTLPKDNAQQFYVSAIGLDQAKKGIFWINVKWARGTLFYMVELQVIDKEIKADFIQVMLNRDVLNDYSNYLKFE